MCPSFIYLFIFYTFCWNLLNGGIGKDRASAKQSLLHCPCPTRRSRNACSMAEFRVKCLTYAHSRARPFPFPTSPSCGLPTTATIPARMLKYQAPVAPRTPDFCQRDLCFHHSESNALPTELPGPARFIHFLDPWFIHSRLVYTRSKIFIILKFIFIYIYTHYSCLN